MHLSQWTLSGQNLVDIHPVRMVNALQQEEPGTIDACSALYMVNALSIERPS